MAIVVSDHGRKYRKGTGRTVDDVSKLLLLSSLKGGARMDMSIPENQMPRSH